MTMLQIPDNEFDGRFIVVGERPATFTKRSDFWKVIKAVIVFKKTFRLFAIRLRRRPQTISVAACDCVVLDTIYWERSLPL